ncbi:hypothetical protein HZH68_003841 [Vespula germanica]|uniref:Uncharacterized protein n=1 Tax=Vespula germanica TaxID=30212 RepID=A0A834NHN3_VESGE|nr:hypothetical protein HZH68_003841 [Vespula germanica]
MQDFYRLQIGVESASKLQLRTCSQTAFSMARHLSNSIMRESEYEPCLTPNQQSPEGQMDDLHQPLASQRFRKRAPFSTWISPNNFGDFHPNPLMSLLTDNSKRIEYPDGTIDGVSRIAAESYQMFHGILIFILLR